MTFAEFAAELRAEREALRAERKAYLTGMHPGDNSGRGIESGYNRGAEDVFELCILAAEEVARNGSIRLSKGKK